jgi:hypothetical protein
MNCVVSQSACRTNFYRGCFEPSRCRKDTVEILSRRSQEPCPLVLITGLETLTGVKQLRRGASITKPPDAQPKPPAVAFAVQMRPGHFVCGFARISGRDEPRVLLLPAATAAKLDLVNVHDSCCFCSTRYFRRTVM